ncbi:hypothetical protein Tco_1317770 [Tanacetum coccineum]
MDHQGFRNSQIKVEGNLLSKGLRKESSDEECSTFGSEDKEYAIFFLMRPVKMIENAFRSGDLNHLIGECPKPPKDKNQKSFVGGSWSDSSEKDDKNVKDETWIFLVIRPYRSSQLESVTP